MNEPQRIQIIISSILAIILEYVPGVAPRFKQLTSWQKRVIVGALCLFVAVAIYYGSCSSAAAAAADCSTNDMLNYIVALVLSVAGNQATHQVTKRDA